MSEMISNNEVVSKGKVEDGVGKSNYFTIILNETKQVIL